MIFDYICKLTFGIILFMTSSVCRLSAYGSLSLSSLKRKSSDWFNWWSTCSFRTRMFDAVDSLLLLKLFCNDKVDRLKNLLGGGVMIPCGVITWFIESLDRHVEENSGFKVWEALDPFCLWLLLPIKPLEPKLSLLLIRSGGESNPVGVCILLIEESDAAANDA